MPKIKKSEFLTQKELAEKLRISYPTLKRWRDKKLIPSYKIGYIVRYKESDIEDLLTKSQISQIKIVNNEQ